MLGVLDLDALQQPGDGLGGPLDAAGAGADRDAGGAAGADQGQGRGVPGEAVLAGQIEGFEAVAEADDPAEQVTGLGSLGPRGHLGSGVLG